MNSKPIVSQEALAELISTNLRNSSDLASAIEEYVSFHSEAIPAMKILSEICHYTEQTNDGSFPIYTDDFFVNCPIDATFFNDKFSKRIYNLIELMNSIPNNKYHVTYNMIKFIGKTVANRVFEVCNDAEGYKNVQVSMKILDILKDIFLRIYVSGQKNLVPLFAYAVIHLCMCEHIFIADKSFYDKVRNVEVDHKPICLSLTDFPSLK